MLTPPDGVPWLVWAVVVIVLAAIGSLPATITALVTRRDTKADLADARESLADIQPKITAAAEQVKNTHETNLREDVDKVSASAADAHTEAALAKESSHRTERLVQDMLRTLRAIEHDIDRRDKLHAEAMTEIRDDQEKTAASLIQHIDEVPQIVTEALAKVPPMIDKAITERLKGTD